MRLPRLIQIQVQNRICVLRWQFHDLRGWGNCVCVRVSVFIHAFHVTYIKYTHFYVTCLYVYMYTRYMSTHTNTHIHTCIYIRACEYFIFIHGGRWKGMAAVMVAEEYVYIFIYTWMHIFIMYIRIQSCRERSRKKVWDGGRGRGGGEGMLDTIYIYVLYISMYDIFIHIRLCVYQIRVKKSSYRSC